MRVDVQSHTRAWTRALRLFLVTLVRILRGGEKAVKATSIPHLDARKLLKLLKKHGYTVERSKKGWLVTSPDGRITNFHESQLSADPRTYMNTMADLKRNIGFDIRKAVR